MPVYRAHSPINYLAWVDPLTPDVETARAEGQLTGLSIKKQTEELRHLQEIRPLQLTQARLSAEQLKMQMDVFKTFHSQEMLALEAEKLRLASVRQIESEREAITTSKIVAQYNKEAPSRLKPILARQDMGALLAYEEDLMERYGEDYWRTDESPWSIAKMKEKLPQEAQQRYDALRAQGRLKNYQERIEIQGRINTLIDKEIARQNELRDKWDFQSRVGYLPSQLGAGGETKRDAVILGKGVENFTTRLINVLESDPVIAEQNRKQLKKLRLLRHQAQEFGEKAGRFREFSRTALASFGIISDKDKELITSDEGKFAQIWVNSIRTIAKGIDSKDPKERKKYEEQLDELFREIEEDTMLMFERSQREQLGIDFGRRYQEELLNLQRNLQTAGELPALPVAGEAITRANLAGNLPNFSSEEEAIAAGYKGQRVMINGVPGVLE